MHVVADAQDTERVNPVWKPGMAPEIDQLVPSKVTELPEAATAMQNEADGHDTENSPFVPVARLVDHPVPSKMMACPSRFTATQNVGVAHETSMIRSLRAPVVEVWNVDQELPLNVPTVLGAPGVPLAAAVAQKVTVGQETS